MGKWNDTGEPIAYLIAFRKYGTWLAGDERGSIDRYHNKYGAPRSVVSSEREKVHFSHSPSVDKGSSASHYVVNGQGGPLPEFD